MTYQKKSSSGRFLHAKQVTSTLHPAELQEPYAGVGATQAADAGKHGMAMVQHMTSSFARDNVEAERRQDARSERNGKVVAATLVEASDEIMLITTGGVLIRTRVSEIREMGRATQGVTLIAVEDGTKLSGLQRIVETDLEEVDLENAPE